MCIRDRYIPMFIQYALDGVIMENESIIPNLIRNLFYSNDKISKIIVLVLVLIMPVSYTHLQRERPVTGNILIDEVGFSFPSGHTDVYKRQK